MIPSLLVIALAFIWLGIETDWMTIRLPYGKVIELIAEPQAIKVEPILMLSAGNPDNYPMTLTTTTKALKALLDQLSKTELTLTEEVWEYDYSDQT